MQPFPQKLVVLLAAVLNHVFAHSILLEHFRQCRTVPVYMELVTCKTACAVDIQGCRKVPKLIRPVFSRLFLLPEIFCLRPPAIFIVCLGQYQFQPFYLLFAFVQNAVMVGVFPGYAKQCRVLIAFQPCIQPVYIRALAGIIGDSLHLRHIDGVCILPCLGSYHDVFIRRRQPAAVRIIRDDPVAVFRPVASCPVLRHRIGIPQAVCRASVHIDAYLVAIDFEIAKYDIPILVVRILMGRQFIKTVASCHGIRPGFFACKPVIFHPVSVFINETLQLYCQCLCNRFFVRILDAVIILVFPDPSADASRRVRQLSRISAGLRLRRRQHIVNLSVWRHHAVAAVCPFDFISRREEFLVLHQGQRDFHFIRLSFFWLRFARRACSRPILHCFYTFPGSCRIRILLP